MSQLLRRGVSLVSASCAVLPMPAAWKQRVLSQCRAPLWRPAGRYLLRLGAFESPNVRQQILQVLVRQREQFDSLAIRHLEFVDPQIRRFALDYLACSGDRSKTALDAVIRRLSDPVALVRAGACELLGQFTSQSERVLPLLLNMLKDVADQVQVAALTGLGELGPNASEMCARLFPFLEAPHRDVRLATIRALAKIRPPAIAVLPHLIQRLFDVNPALRAASAELIGSYGIDSRLCVGALLQHLDDVDRSVREAVVRSLGQIGQFPELVLPRLIRCLADHRDWGVQGAAATACGQFGDSAKDIVGMLIDLLSDDAESVRLAAIEGLSGLGNAATPLAVEALLCFVSGTDTLRVRRAAAKALTRMSRLISPLLPDVLHLMSTATEETRSLLVVVIGGMESAIQDVVPVLISCLGDVSPQVRRTASRALGRIGAASLRNFRLMLESKLSHKDSGVREITLRTIGLLGPEMRETRDAVAQLLEDPRSTVRSAAADTLQRLSVLPTAKESVASLVSDRNQAMRVHSTSLCVDRDL